MLNKKKFQLLKSFIDSDFLFLNKKLKKSNRYLDQSIKLEGGSVSYLNSIETLKSVKQFLRVLQFLYSKDKKTIHIVLKNRQFIKIAEIFFNKKDLGFYYSIKDSVNVQNSEVEDQLLILFDHLNNNSLLLKKLFDKNIFLMNKINTKIEKSNWGSYKVYNEVDDFKKFLFFLVLIELIFNKK
tara:strand:- start:802 stop:1350 length:549 start_codon:yes stop_codon:yes gene_type:complete